MKTEEKTIAGLKPCPFCGSHPEIQRDELVMIERQKCGQAQVICAEEKDSVSDWNRRATPDQSEPTAAPHDGWMPIETAPKDGSEIIVFHHAAGVCAAFCPGDGFAWHVMDGRNTMIGKISGKSLPTLTSFIDPPTHWMPLPKAPS